VTPLVSIVIPTFARTARLRQCLDACSRLQVDAPFEVIVVDDGSPDSVAPVIEDMRDRLCVALVTQARRGPGLARNAGAAIARGRYLAFLDDDCRPAVDWLAVLVRELDRDPARLVGGRVENELTANRYSEASEWIGQFVYRYNQRPTAHEPFFTTNNIALSADLFRTVGGFTAAIPSGTAEDKDFCDRWRASGLSLAHAPAALVYHAHDLGFRRFVRQHFNYGRGILAFRLLRRSRAGRVVSPHAAGVNASATPCADVRRRLPTAGTDRAGMPLLPEPLSFYAELVVSPIRTLGWRRGWRLAGLLLVSQAATLAGAAREALRWRALAEARSNAAEV
jgi:glycosyltransferase involved in cell wall biosynthesis